MAKGITTKLLKAHRQATAAADLCRQACVDASLRLGNLPVASVGATELRRQLDAAGAAQVLLTQAVAILAGVRDGANRVR